MKKICLTLVGLYIGLFAGFAQTSNDSSAYKPKELTFEEANIVSSYYQQDGNNSAVTGGIGSEKLTDISNSFEVKLFKYDNNYRKHTLDFELGIDHYTSASSDMIDLKANSSASHSDNRVYPAVNWTMENEKTGVTIGAGAGYSHEFDYVSYNGNFNVAVKTKNRMGEFSAKVQAFLDQVKLILPKELSAAGNNNSGASRGHHEYASTPRNTYDLALSYSQIVNKNFQLMLMTDVVAQNGYLALPFHRVYFTNGSVHQETLPSSRLKIPVAIRASYFLGDRVILRSYYRFYKDDWGITAHTINIETPVKISPFVSISPFYRFYDQTGSKYFAPYAKHTAADTYYTSNYDLGTFHSNFYGAGLRITPANGILGATHFNMIEIRYGHYAKNIPLNSDVISLNLKFK